MFTEFSDFETAFCKLMLTAASITNQMKMIKEKKSY